MEVEREKGEGLSRMAGCLWNYFGEKVHVVRGNYRRKNEKKGEG